MPDEYEPTDLQFPSDDEPVAVTPTLPSKKPKQPSLVDVTGTGENEKATSRFFEDGDSMPNNKPLDNGWDDEEGEIAAAKTCCRNTEIIKEKSIRVVECSGRSSGRSNIFAF